MFKNTCFQIIPLSIYEQQRSVTAAQNKLSDIEGVINGSVETLSFLSSRFALNCVLNCYLLMNLLFPVLI